MIDDRLADGEMYRRLRMICRQALAPIAKRGMKYCAEVLRYRTAKTDYIGCPFVFMGIRLLQSYCDQSIFRHLAPPMSNFGHLMMTKHHYHARHW